MKLTTLTLAMTAMATLTLADPVAEPVAEPQPEAMADPKIHWFDHDWENAVKCAKKNPDFNTVIERFCSKGDIMTPSDYAFKGKVYKKVALQIKAPTCKTPQWLPPWYCRTQFHALCANRPGGLGMISRGKDACQLLILARRYPKKKHHKGKKKHHGKKGKKHHRREEEEEVMDGEGIDLAPGIVKVEDDFDEGPDEL